MMEIGHTCGSLVIIFGVHTEESAARWGRALKLPSLHIAALAKMDVNGDSHFLPQSTRKLPKAKVRFGGPR
jgi:hypothetical protein